MKATFCIAGILLASCVHALSPKVDSVAENNPNHFFFGPDVLCLQQNSRVNHIRVKGAHFFGGFRVGYEYLKPKAFYAGIDLFASSDNKDFAASLNGRKLSWHKADRAFSNLEMRFGYTFAPTNWMLSPFLGIGLYDIYPVDHHNVQGYKETLPYADVGIRSRYAFNSTFELGCNFKILGTFDARQRFKYRGGKQTSHHNMWGGEISVPLIWHFGSEKRWDVQLEPYFLKLDFTEIQNAYGARLLFGYRF